ncbi:MAG: hypothetical protein ACI9CF_001353 [Candidatus Omnitrophota bacterium]|jgi:hypothetical protein
MKNYFKLYEIHTLQYLNQLSFELERSVDLASIPDSQWQLLKSKGFDYLWMMGIWERSPAGLQCALECVNLQKTYDVLLPGWTAGDIAGSPYAIHGYDVDPLIGTWSDLKKLRQKLNRSGIQLIVDFVPNHLAMDHPWTLTHPERFISTPVKQYDGEIDSSIGFIAGDHVIFHGKDPYFSPWTDTAQINAFSADMRQVLIQELLHIAEVADGVRCDMAMLLLNQVFKSVWKTHLPTDVKPKREFWDEVIGGVRAKYPNFKFIAESYWDMEDKLIELGFDYCYDKSLYDLLEQGDASILRAHLDCLSETTISKSVHFTENHDETRAIKAFGKEKSLAAAAIMATLPGIWLSHDGQEKGEIHHIPVQMAHFESQAVDGDVQKFYGALHEFTNQEAFRSGDWQIRDVQAAWPESRVHQNLLVWVWKSAKVWRLVAINWSAIESCGRADVLDEVGELERLIIRDQLNNEIYERSGDELREQGLYLSLKPWQVHFFEPVYTE